MDRQLGYLFLICLFFSLHLKAQKIISEGKLLYNISLLSGSDQPAIADAFNGAQLVVWLKANQVRIDFESRLRSQTTLYNGLDKSGVLLKTSGQEKYLIRMNAQQWQQYNRKYKDIAFVSNGDKLQIGNYSTEKHTASLADGTEITVYLSKELMPLTKGYDAAFAGLNGLPIVYEIKTDKVVVKYTLNQVQWNLPVSAATFDIPQSGFKELEFRQ